MTCPLNDPPPPPLKSVVSAKHAFKLFSRQEKGGKEKAWRIPRRDSRTSSFSLILYVTLIDGFATTLRSILFGGGGEMSLESTVELKLTILQGQYTELAHGRTFLWSFPVGGGCPICVCLPFLAVFPSPSD